MNLKKETYVRWIYLYVYKKKLDKEEKGLIKRRTSFFVIFYSIFNLVSNKLQSNFPYTIMQLNHYYLD